MAAATAAKKVVEGPNFGDLGFLSSGYSIAEGDYILFFTVQLFAGFGKEKKGPDRLGLMVDAFPLADPTEDSKKQFFLSMGSKAHESWAPNPETGKGIIAVVGGKGQPPNDQTNYGIFLKSLYDSGLPAGVFSNDISVLDGIHTHLHSIDPPEARKGFASQNLLDDNPGQEQRKDNKITVVTEIKDDGKPWEGTGGLPKGAKPAAKAAGKPVAVPAKAAAKPAEEVPTETAGEDDQSLMEAAAEGLYAAVQASPTGGSFIKVKSDAFKAIVANKGEEIANAVTNGIFKNEATVNSLLGDLGYKKEGVKVVAL